MSNRAHLQNAKSRRQQNGAALLVILLIVLASGVYAFLNYNSATNANLERDRITTEALAQAKAALLGYAASRPLYPPPASNINNIPGEFPCPDLGNDGTDSIEASGGGCNSDTLQLGRLPWKTLGLPDLRDGSGERLWYAISTDFTRSPHNSALNSDTLGSIKLRDASGALQSTRIIALIIAPGQPLTRPTSSGNSTAYQQNRDASGINQAINYLDLSFGEDNADFENSVSSTNGFITGPIRSTTGDILLNDRVLAITTSDLSPLIARRVAGEVANCLTKYSQDATSIGRFPWPANASYAEVDSALSGFIPDTPFSTSGALGMATVWQGNCSITSNQYWWLNWKSKVSINLASNHQPAAAAPPNTCGVNGWTGNCVNTNKQFVVTVNIPPLSITRSVP